VILGGVNGSEVDAMIRRHLAMLLVGVQCGDDDTVLKLARAETHRLVGVVIACLRAHVLNTAGQCSTCRAPECELRKDIRLALLPVRQPSPELG
jgi:hypothetical protein